MWMTIDEQLFLKSKLNENQKVLEWGCGSSTIDISKIVKEVHSIEHNMAWYNNIIEQLLNNSNVTLHLCEPDVEYIEGGHCGTFQQFETYMNTYPITQCNEMTIMNLIFTYKLNCWKPFPQIVGSKYLFGWNEKNYKGYPKWDHFHFIKYSATR